MNVEFGIENRDILRSRSDECGRFTLSERRVYLEGEEGRENVGLQTFHPVPRDTHLPFNGNVSMNVLKTCDSCLYLLT